MKKKWKTILIGSFVAVICLIFNSCAAFMTSGVPTLAFAEYGLESGDEDSQQKSDIEIKIEVVRLSHIYDFPNLFSFRLESLPTMYADNAILQGEYKPSVRGRQWEFPFASPDAKMQLLFCFCKIKNNTKNILRMKDARIYMILEGVDPLPAINSFNVLLEQADYFEEVTNRQRTRETVMFVLQKAPLPEGFFRSIVLYNMENFKLINDIDAEILPGFSYEGILAFPVIPTISSSAKISFFDVTTKVDAAGIPVEKTQFDFILKRQYVQMWLDRSTNRWRVGSPPPVEGKL